MRTQEQIFCDEYIICGNATQAALRAGYAQGTAGSANAWIRERNPKKPELKAYIERRKSEICEALGVKAEDIVDYLASVLRGESRAEVVVVEGTGDGMSQARSIMKGPDEKERLKAAELLGKYFGLFTDNVKVQGGVPVIVDDLRGREDG